MSKNRLVPDLPWLPHICCVNTFIRNPFNIDYKGEILNLTLLFFFEGNDLLWQQRGAEFDQAVN